MWLQSNQSVQKGRLQLALHEHKGERGKVVGLGMTDISACSKQMN